MLNCYCNESTENPVPLISIEEQQFSAWQAKQSDFVRNWLASNQFTAKSGSYCAVPDADGQTDFVLLGLKDADDINSLAGLSTVLPARLYTLKSELAADVQREFAIAWGLNAYRFDRYKKNDKPQAQLLIDDSFVHDVVSAIFRVRDLVNTPTEDMGPAQLAQAAEDIAKNYNADIEVTIGEQLIQNNFPAIYAVGRASASAPRLIDMRWGKSQHPKVTLVGKGVCFDSGGLDIKPSAGMRIMKKDMGGAAHVLGLAQLIMAQNLPIQLRVLVPAVENAISSNAYRPGDVLQTRLGKTIEVGNTDAEGRVILSDALAYACEEDPDVIIDFATLTGAARIAMGTDMGAMFTNNDELAAQLTKYSLQTQDPIWHMPLYKPYRKLNESPIADITNSGPSVYGGAITAALFLEAFVKSDIPWVHFDIMAWNLSSRPGKPEGGEAVGLRAVFAYLATQYQ